MENNIQSSQSMLTPKDLLQAKKRKSLSISNATVKQMRMLAAPPPLTQIIAEKQSPATTAQTRERRNLLETAMLSPNAFECDSAFERLNPVHSKPTNCQAKDVFAYAAPPPPPPPASSPPPTRLPLSGNQFQECFPIIDVENEIPSAQMEQFNVFDDFSQIKETNNLLKTLTSNCNEKQDVGNQEDENNQDDENNVLIGTSKMEKELQERVAEAYNTSSSSEKLIFPSADYWYLCQKELLLKDKIIFHKTQYCFHHVICGKMLTELNILNKMKDECFK